MAVTIESGPARVIASGMATCFMGHDLTLRITQPAPLVLEIAFHSDDGVPDVDVNISKHEGRLRMVCVNFDSTDGRGSAEPVLLGEAKDQLIFLHFRVFRFGRTDDRTVHYTLFSVTKESVDWTATGQSE